MERYQHSLKHLERALKVTSGGAQTMSKQANRFPLGAYPTALLAGGGAHVVDMDGQTYLDFICGLACMTLGYGRKEIRAAVIEQLDAGVSFSLAHPLEVEVAEALCDLIPCAEQVRFVKTGSEANEAAIRVARKATGCDKILTVAEGYHSWHSWFQSVKPVHPGIPDPYRSMVVTVPYNNLPAFEQAFQSCDELEGWHRIAAVILEPCHYVEPAPGFLQGVRDLCTKYGAVLIFDEIVTGFRWATAGAQEYHGVTPDLATFGKACANGFPLAFLCGKQDLMQHADVVSGTFGGETLSLAACRAVLDIYRKEPIIETLWARGRQLQQGFNDLAHVLDVPAICDGFAVKPRIAFENPSDPMTPYGKQMAMSLFLQETAKRGILWHPAGGNISAAMTKEHIEQALSGMAEVLVIVKLALTLNDWSGLVGQPIQTSPMVRKA